MGGCEPRGLDLNEEQNEFAQNIQRSANTLLTVINDILDFSKIESGRLDIEEVQFSLGVVLRDVSKMLSFAAERKKLLFQSDIRLGGHGDLIVLGDPGRVRQILTNLCKLSCAVFVTHSLSFPVLSLDSFRLIFSSFHRLFWSHNSNLHH